MKILTENNNINEEVINLSEGNNNVRKNNLNEINSNKEINSNEFYNTNGINFFFLLINNIIIKLII